MNYYKNKIKLVYISKEHITFVDKTPWGEYEFAEYTMYDASTVYKSDTIFIVTDLSLQQDLHDERRTTKFLLAEGYRVIVDAVWEGFCRHGHRLKFKWGSQVHMMYTGTKNYYGDNDQIIPNFFWIHEYLYNKSKGLDLYKPVPRTDSKKYNFFMPMRAQKPHRNMILDSFTDLLPRALYSYVDNGIVLPMDKSDSNMLLSTEHNFDRNFNSDWYDDTYFSVVVETFASMTLPELTAFRHSNLTGNENDLRKQKIIVNKAPEKGRKNCFRSGGSTVLTEKTFKPIAFEHPFIIFGQVGTLKRLHRIGFETFPHLFNESYDVEGSITARLDMIRDCVTEFNTEKYMDPLTKEVLDHNHAHFYNADTIRQMIDLEIVCPLMDFINA